MSVTLALWSALALFATGADPAGAAVVVEGEASCPRASDVAARLVELLPAVTSDELDTARIDERDDGIELVLRRDDGTLVGRRHLPASGTCDERARDAAIVLATWESDVHPTFQLPLPPPPPLPPLPPVAPPALPVAPTSTSIVVAPAVMSPAAGPTLRWDLGGGLSGSLAGGATAAGVRVTGTLLGARGFGAQLGLHGDSQRSTQTGSGEAIWSRATASVGPAVRGALGRWAAEANLSLAAGFFRVHGQGYPVLYRQDALDGALGAGLRLVAPGTAWRPWLTLDATRWLGGLTVRETVTGQIRDVPVWLVSASLGVSFFSR